MEMKLTEKEICDMAEREQGLPSIRGRLYFIAERRSCEYRYWVVQVCAEVVQVQWMSFLGEMH